MPVTSYAFRKGMIILYIAYEEQPNNNQNKQTNK